MKFNITGPNHNNSKVSYKVYLSNTSRVLHKDVLKPYSITIFNPIHKVTKVPHVKFNICKSFNNQSFALPANVFRNSCLNTCKKPSLTNIRKPLRGTSNLSYLKARKSGDRRYIMVVKLMLVLYWKIICVAN